MNSAGVPAPGQLALKRIQGAAKPRAVVSNTSRHSRPTRSSVTRSSRGRGRNGIR